MAGKATRTRVQTPVEELIAALTGDQLREVFRQRPTITPMSSVTCG